MSKQATSLPMSKLTMLQRDGITAYHEAAERGDVKEIERMFEEDKFSLKKLMEPDFSGQTIMHYAALSKNWKVVIDKLREFAATEEEDLDLFKADHAGLTPLHYAAMSGDVDAIKDEDVSVEEIKKTYKVYVDFAETRFSEDEIPIVKGDDFLIARSGVVNSDPSSIASMCGNIASMCGNNEFILEICKKTKLSISDLLGNINSNRFAVIPPRQSSAKIRETVNFFKQNGLKIKELDDKDYKFILSQAYGGTYVSSINSDSDFLEYFLRASSQEQKEKFCPALISEISQKITFWKERAKIHKHDVTNFNLVYEEIDPQALLEADFNTKLLEIVSSINQPKIELQGAYENLPDLPNDIIFGGIFDYVGSGMPYRKKPQEVFPEFFAKQNLDESKENPEEVTPEEDTELKEAKALSLQLQAHRNQQAVENKPEKQHHTPQKIHHEFVEAVIKKSKIEKVDKASAKAALLNYVTQVDADSLKEKMGITDDLKSAQSKEGVSRFINELTASGVIIKSSERRSFCCIPYDTTITNFDPKNLEQKNIVPPAISSPAPIAEALNDSRNRTYVAESVLIDEEAKVGDDGAIHHRPHHLPSQSPQRSSVVELANSTDRTNSGNTH